MRRRDLVRGRDLVRLRDLVRRAPPLLRGGVRAFGRRRLWLVSCIILYTPKKIELLYINK